MKSLKFCIWLFCYLLVHSASLFFIVYFYFYFFLVDTVFLDVNPAGKSFHFDFLLLLLLSFFTFQTDKDMVFSKSGKKGHYPLLFVDGEFIGDFDQVQTLNEEELLSQKLKA
jgi:hypothetical protein